MDLTLDRNLVFFDIEATGLNVVRDRIIQIALIKYRKKGGEPEELSLLINPGIPISEEAMNVHGILPKDVARKPTFAQVADEIYEFIGSADLAGYNSNRFDIPILMEEFARVGMEFDVSRRRLIDVQRIFYKMEPRTLKAALRYYRGMKMENAHDAMADVRATIAVFEGQLDRYKETDYEDEDGNLTPKPLGGDIKSIHDFCNDQRFLDATQKMRMDHEGRAVFNFGKYNGQAVADVFARDKNYYNWILNKEFSSQVKQLAKQIYQEVERSNRS